MYRSFNVVVCCVAYFVAVLGRLDMFTKDEVKYTFFPFSGKSIHFKVKTANDAHVGLTTGPAESDPMIEVVIGGWANTNSVIRRRFRTIPEKVTTESPGILSAGEFRGFWVRWDAGVISVGREDTEIPFMSWADPNPFHVTHVGVHTGFGASGTWIIEDTPVTPPPVISTPINIVHNLHCSTEPQSKLSCQDIRTDDDKKYKFYKYSGSTVNFRVKAANDVHVGLSRAPRMYEPMIEVVIGGWGNTKSVIRRQFRSVPEKVTVETPRILDADEFRGFWVSWDGGVIEVGREGADVPFMSWADPEPFPVAYIGIHTGFGSTGSWKIEDPPEIPVGVAPPSQADSLCCKCCYKKPLINFKDVSTDDTKEYKYFPYTNTSLNFRVKAANDAHVGLSTGPTRDETKIEVVIGGWGNTKSVLRRLLKSVPEKVAVETPGILNEDELRGFWVRWSGSVILVGREGTDVPFMSWPDPEPFSVTHIGVHTGFGSSGTWKIEDPSSPPAAAALPDSAPDVVLDSLCCKCCNHGPLPLGYTTTAPAFTNAFVSNKRSRRELNQRLTTPATTYTST